MKRWSIIKGMVYGVCEILDGIRCLLMLGYPITSRYSLSSQWIFWWSKHEFQKRRQSKLKGV